MFDRLFLAGSVGRYEPAALAWHDQWRERGDVFALEWRYGTGSGARLAKLVPPGHEARIDVSITDEYPLAQAFVVISAVRRQS